MRANVLNDKALERYAGRFVWLAIDIENAKNAAFLKKYPIPAVPMLFVIDPTKGSVAIRYVGGATLPQLTKLLDEGERAVHGTAAALADTLIARADRFAASGHNAAAVPAYARSIAAAPKGWAPFGRAVESYVFTLQAAGFNQRCATTARALYPKVKGSSSAANVAATGLSCAAGLDAKVAGRQPLLETLERDIREVLADATIDLSGDDRSGLYESLADARETVGDKDAATAVRQEWVRFLEQQAAAAATPDQRSVYDSHRLTAYLALGTPEKAIPMLEQSARDFPDEYNPPARLAAAYNAMKEYDKALVESEKALAKVYGPRKLSVYRTRIATYLGKGDRKSAKQTLDEALAYANALPKAQRNVNTIAALRKQLQDAP